MKIITTTTTDRKKLYQMTKGAAIHRIQDSEGKTLQVQNYVLYEDIKADGNAMTILALEDAAGEFYATNSPTFRETFLDIATICGDVPEAVIGESIRIVSSTSKAGRKFFVAMWA